LTGDFDFEALTGILARDLLRLTRLVYAGFTVGFRVLAFARELGCLAFSGDLLYFFDIWLFDRFARRQRFLNSFRSGSALSFNLRWFLNLS